MRWDHEYPDDAYTRWRLAEIEAEVRETLDLPRFWLQRPAPHFPDEEEEQAGGNRQTTE